MQLRQNVDYSHLQGTFPTKTKRFENRGALSLSPQPVAAQRVKRRAVLVCGGRGACSPDDVYRNSTNDRQVVGCNMVARTPREGPEMPQAQRSGISPLDFFENESKVLLWVFKAGRQAHSPCIFASMGVPNGTLGARNGANVKLEQRWVGAVWLEVHRQDRRPRFPVISCPPSPHMDLKP